MKSGNENMQSRENGRVRRKKSTIFLFLLLLVLVFGLTSLANLWKGELRAERVQVRGTRILTEKEVAALASVSFGMPLYDVDLSQVRSRLLSNPFIREAVVSHDLPSTIKIAVEERSPVALLGGLEPYYLSEDGYVLPPVTSKEVFDLPVITGLAQQKPVKAGMKIGSENFKAAIEILHEAAATDSEIYHLISEINIGGIAPIVYTAEHGIPIFFDRENIHAQLVHLQTFWNSYVRQKGPDQLSSIDLRFEDQVVVRWNATPSHEKSL
jgi:cell division protein FtsQ